MTNQELEFDSHQEMWEYLIGGGEICLISDRDAQVGLENGRINTPYNIGEYQYWQRYEKPKWYENIPEQGILCRVATGTGTKSVRAIKDYVVNGLHTYRDDYGNHWAFAEPLTFEEAVELIYKPLDT